MIIRLKRGRAKPVWAGHPWVFSGAIHRVEGAAEPPGRLVPLVDHRDALVGWGHHSPDAPIALRMWAYAPPGAPVGTPPPDMEALLGQRFREARARRELLGLPADDTDAYRLLNSEGDRTPGAVVDVFGDVAVLQLGTPGVAALQDKLVALVRETSGARHVIRRISPDAARLETLPAVHEDDEDDDAAEAPRRRVIRENGLRFVIDPEGGQKTGFYLDQREHRQAVAALSRGKRLLDVCSFGAAFSLHALAAGAREAVAVDTSPRAEAMALESAAENGQEGLVFDRRDAFVALKERAAAGERFEVVVVDPPKFARSRREVDAAVQKVTRLNELALRCLADGGLLVTCTCSRHIDAGTLERAASTAAQRANRMLHLLRDGGQAPDHPTLAAFPEGRYLKVLYFQASARS